MRSFTSMYRIVRALQRRVVASPALHDPFRHAAVAVSCEWGALDRIDLETSGRVLLTGWSRHGRIPALSVSVNGEPARFEKSFELLRRDLVPPARGFGAEYVGPQAGRARSLVVQQDGRELARLAVDMPVHIPHYSGLFDERRVLHRESIYGHGPPVAEANPDVVQLALS